MSAESLAKTSASHHCCFRFHEMQSTCTIYPALGRTPARVATVLEPAFEL